MKITDETIDKLSNLCKLEFDNESRDEMKQDLERIVGFCEQLNQLDTAHVEPLIYMSDEVNNLRDDVVKNMISKDDALKNAPSKDTDYFKVPKFIEK